MSTVPPAMPVPERSFTIAIATYRRPEGLRRLLASFDRLEWPAEWRFDGVLVVDNDPEGSARPVADEVAAAAPWPLRYVTEATPGVVAARNRALRETSATHVAMIDDDEVATTGWPRGLLEVADATSAPLVGGEVRPETEVPVPPWMLKPSYLGRATHPDGSAVTRVTCGNVLIDRRLLDQYDPLFDERFALIGGEDSFLAAMLDHEGHDVRWSATAIAVEFFPPARCSLTWLRQRWRRNGTIMALVPLTLSESRWRRARLGIGLVADGLVRVVYGAVAPLLPGRRRDEFQRAEALRQRMQGLGQIEAVFGRRPVNYGPGGIESP